MFCYSGKIVIVSSFDLITVLIFDFWHGIRVLLGKLLVFYSFLAMISDNSSLSAFDGFTIWILKLLQCDIFKTRDDKCVFLYAL